MAGLAPFYMVEDFDFQELTSSNEVTGDFDVSFQWRRLGECAGPAFGNEGNINVSRLSRRLFLVCGLQIEASFGCP